MPDQKIDNLLNLALEADTEERSKSQNLETGFDRETNLWEVIVKYNGDVDGLQGEGITVVPLLGNFALVTLSQQRLEEYSRRPQVEFIEKPKRLYFALASAKLASCIVEVQRGAGEIPNLTGKGILMGIVDSGVDIRHPDFRNENGSTRILRLWDQTADGIPPKGYARGAEYTKEQLNVLLENDADNGTAGSAIDISRLPGQDLSGHGTAVLGIAAGNGLASNGRYRGVAYESDILAVKLGIPGEQSFPRTSELIQGVDYLVRQAVELNRPMVINLSFGNNYGSHRGDSLLETYLDTVANMGRLVICTGTGNNGTGNLHTNGRLLQGETKEIEIGVSPFEPVFNIQLWKSYADAVDIYLEAPSGERIGPLSERLGAQRYPIANIQLLIYYGKPGPFQLTQEIYFDFIPRGNYIDSGVWKLILVGRNIKEGVYELWLPGGNVLNPNTGFYFPQAEGTLTIPSTARRVISVGAYNSGNDSYADFSGRGGVGDSGIVLENGLFGRGGAGVWGMKPDLAAPGVDITTTAAGGGYRSVTGTSFAAPFVSGAAALLMEWGIVQGNDLYLYGEKLKAYLQRGARPLPGFEEYPNEQIGWGEDVIIRLH